MNKHTTAAMVGLMTPLIAFASPVFADLPDRPEEIQFQPLDFQPPRMEDYRHELSSGVPVYLAPSSEFPLITITFSFKGGSYLDPADSIGLANMTGAMIRRGGTQTISAQEFDERFDFLAANVFTNSGATTSTASINTLTSNLDEAFELFMDMVRNPGFEPAKVELFRKEMIESMKQRNDDAQGILSREWNMMMYGEDHFEGAEPTIDTLRNITIEDLRAFHAKVFHPGNMIIGVTGDFQEQEMLDRLEQALEGWSHGEAMPDPAPPSAQLEPGVYHIEKDIPQGKVFIGHRGVQRDHPDHYALMVMNDILGGGGFTSRLVSRVRSDEGLAYSVGSQMAMDPFYPGEFRALFQSKNRTVALATKIILEEINEIRTQPVTETELATSKNSFIETFPRRFESKQAIINTFINDEWTHRPRGYWQTFREKIAAVTAQDVQRAAQAHLDPENLAILVVGKWDEIQGGDLEGRATMSEFFDGKYEELPLRDPLTLKPLK